METLPTTQTPAQGAPQAVALSGPTAQPAQLPGAASAPHSGYRSGCACSSCEAKRARWRAKHHQQRARKLGGTAAPQAGAPVPASASAPDPAQTASNSPPVVPWSADTLKPLFEELIPAIERETVKSLSDKAAKISTELAQEVARDAAWSPPAKGALTNQAPAVAAKWLNASGISAENAGEVICGIAIVCIWNSHRVLLNKLTEMAAKNPPGESQQNATVPFPKTA